MPDKILNNIPNQVWERIGYVFVFLVGIVIDGFPFYSAGLIIIAALYCGLYDKKIMEKLKNKHVLFFFQCVVIVYMLIFVSYILYWLYSNISIYGLLTNASALSEVMLYKLNTGRNLVISIALLASIKSIAMTRTLFVEQILLVNEWFAKYIINTFTGKKEPKIFDNLTEYQRDKICDAYEGDDKSICEETNSEIEELRKREIFKYADEIVNIKMDSVGILHNKRRYRLTEKAKKELDKYSNNLSLAFDKSTR